MLIFQLVHEQTEECLLLLPLKRPQNPHTPLRCLLQSDWPGRRHSYCSYPINNPFPNSHCVLITTESMHSGYPWDPENRSKWEIASEPWQLLLQHWRNATDPLANRNLHTLTIIPHITTSLVWETLIPILRQNEHGKILVLNSYPTMVERVLEHYKHKPRSGVLITGQPGIGKD